MRRKLHTCVPPIGEQQQNEERRASERARRGDHDTSHAQECGIVMKSLARKGPGGAPDLSAVAVRV